MTQAQETAAAVSRRIASMLSEVGDSLTAAGVAEHAAMICRELGATAVSMLPTERTVRYYQGRGIVTPPEGQTKAARYGRRQVLETVAGKLAGATRGWTLAEAAERIQDADMSDLVQLVAECVRGDAHERSLGELRPLHPVLLRAAPEEDVPPADEQSYAPAGEARLSWTIDLGAGAYAVVPAAHPVIATGNGPVALGRRLRAVMGGIDPDQVDSTR